METYKRGKYYYFDVTINNRRVRKSTKQTSKALADMVANDRLQKARDTSVDSILRKAPILEEFAPEFLKWNETTQSFGKDMKKFLRNGWRLLSVTKLAHMRMDAITSQEWDTTEFPGSEYNANAALYTLKRMCREAKNWKKFFGDIPVIKSRTVWAREMKMSYDQARQIDAKFGEKAGESQDAFRIICSTGMNPKECFEMRWEYVHWNPAKPFYQTPNGKRQSRVRQVPLNLPPFHSLDILKRRHLEQGSPKQGWVFPSPNSSMGHLTTIQKPFALARAKAGLPDKLVLYCARHGVATALAEVTTLKNTMNLLGHSRADTAMRYQHPEMNQEIAERLWAKSKVQ